MCDGDDGVMRLLYLFTDFDDCSLLAMVSLGVPFKFEENISPTVVASYGGMRNCSHGESCHVIAMKRQGPKADLKMEMAHI